MEANPCGPSDQLDCAVVVGRSEPTGDAQQVEAEALGKRALEIVGVVPDDRDRGGRDPERDERGCEEWPVPVVAIAADELEPDATIAARGRPTPDANPSA